MVNSAVTEVPPGRGESCGAAASLWGGTKAAPARDVQTLPLVDPAVLQDLEDELGRSDLATNFAKDYVGLWEQREHRLAASLADADRDAALESVISLKVSSTMVGARRLAGLAQVLESAVRGGDLSGGLVRDLISVQGRATIEELRVQYLQHRV